MLTAFVGLKAQDCRDIVLPLFNYDTARFDAYPAAKIMYRCLYSRASFYESDTIPEGAHVYDISEVREANGTQYLPQTFVVDLTTLSYYAYNFLDFQKRFVRGNITLCFSTPSSAHPYLVLRSIEESHRLAGEAERAYYREQGDN